MGLLPAEWRLQDYRKLGVREMATKAAASMKSPWPKVFIWIESHDAAVRKVNVNKASKHRNVGLGVTSDAK